MNWFLGLRKIQGYFHNIPVFMTVQAQDPNRWLMSMQASVSDKKTDFQELVIFYNSINSILELVMNFRKILGFLPYFETHQLSKIPLQTTAMLPFITT